MTDTPILPDWVLIEAAKRGAFIGDVSDLQHSYESIKVYRALCDMILKHEQPPVDRRLLCAEQAASEWDNSLLLPPIDVAVRAIELYLEGYGK
jgi:hypothetical protein